MDPYTKASISHCILSFNPLSKKEMTSVFKQVSEYRWPLLTPEDNPLTTDLYCLLNALVPRRKILLFFKIWLYNFHLRISTCASQWLYISFIYYLSLLHIFVFPMAADYPIAITIYFVLKSSHRSIQTLIFLISKFWWSKSFTVIPFAWTVTVSDKAGPNAGQDWGKSTW